MDKQKLQKPMLDEKTGLPTLKLPKSLYNKHWWVADPVACVKRTAWGRQPWRIIIGLLMADAWDQEFEAMPGAGEPKDKVCDALDQWEQWKTWAHATKKDDRHLRLVEGE